MLRHLRDTSLSGVDIKPWHIELKKTVGFINGEDRSIWMAECALCPDMVFAVTERHETILHGMAIHTLVTHMPTTWWWSSEPLVNIVPYLMSVDVLEENGDTVRYQYRQVVSPF